jgi:Putative metal-binding motif/FG-GAP-like repeat/FG-GAP repeat
MPTRAHSCSLALLLAFACGKGDEDTATGDEVDPDRLDEDGDAYLAAVDCDDTDPAVHPGASELCNDSDDDCDLLVDEEPIDGTTWYADADGDGHGGPDYSVVSCDRPVGYVALATDCDDTASDAHPGGVEVCDGNDNDCDGTVDVGAIDVQIWYRDNDGDGYGDTNSIAAESCEAPVGTANNDLDCDDTDPLATPGSWWYFDADGDGYGNADLPLRSCQGPLGYVVDATDCDDTTSAAFPGGIEVCDGADNDCNGSSDGSDAADAIYWYDDIDGDGYGAPGTGALGCTASGWTSIDDQDCDDSDILTHPGATETCDDGIDQDCNGRVDNTCLSESSVLDAWASLVGDTTYDYGAYALRSTHDATGDGVTDLVVGAYGSDANAFNGGEVYVLAGPLSSGDAQSMSDGAVAFQGAENVGFGRTLGVGDWNSDGDADLVVGALYGPDGAGSVYLFNGPLSGGLDTGSALRVDGSTTYDYFGADGVSDDHDIDGDGMPDLVVGALGSDTNGSGAGAAYLFLGPLTASGGAGDADATIVGDAAGDYLGRAVDAGGDLDGDGIVDVIVSAYSTTTGNVYVFLGGVAGTLVASDADATVSGPSSDSGFGYAARNVGDIDRDGRDDLAVGAPTYDLGSSSSVGAIYLFTGPFSGAVAATDATWAMEGDDDFSFMGQSLGEAGDLDLDGNPDLAFGAPSAGAGPSGEGAGFIVYGPMEGSWGVANADHMIRGGTSGDYAGWEVQIGGDLDVDGLPDLVMGSQRYGSYTGQVWLVSSSSL